MVGLLEEIIDLNSELKAAQVNLADPHEIIRVLNGVKSLLNPDDIAYGKSGPGYTAYHAALADFVEAVGDWAGSNGYLFGFGLHASPKTLERFHDSLMRQGLSPNPDLLAPELESRVDQNFLKADPETMARLYITARASFEAVKADADAKVSSQAYIARLMRSVRNRNISSQVAAEITEIVATARSAGLSDRVCEFLLKKWQIDNDIKSVSPRRPKGGLPDRARRQEI